MAASSLADALDDIALDINPPAQTTAATNSQSAAPKVNLDWQSFPTTAATNVTAQSAQSATSPRTAGAAAQPAATPGQGSDAGTNPLACFMPSFWTQKFDVSTADVMLRIRMAAWPLEQTTFLQAVQQRVDLYGPIWLCATLVFVIAAGSSVHSFLNFKPGQLVSIWKYDFKTVTLALMTVYGYFFGAAAGVWLGGSYLAVPNAPNLVSLVCVYGYSVTPFIPAALLSAIPVGGLQWAVCTVAGVLSALFVFKNLWPSLRDGAVPPTTARTAAAIVVFAQLSFAVACKLYFFSY